MNIATLLPADTVAVRGLVLQLRLRVNAQPNIRLVCSLVWMLKID
jgi:hypothetical protein